MQKINQLILSFLICFFTISSIVFADDLSISQFPDSPREGEEVKMTLSSDKYDLDRATITWTVDGQVNDQGVGRKTLTINAPSNGIAQVVVVKVEQEGLNPSEFQKVLEANTNFILYEGADSYVPSFYKGRRLPPKEGTVRAAFFSFKDGNIDGLAPGTNANYTWNINGEDNKQLSGSNKVINSIITRVTDNVLNVKVLRTDGSVNMKSAESAIPLQKPEVVIYKTDQNKLTRSILADNEIGKQIFLLVEPYFFSTTNKTSTDMKYTWKQNDIEVQLPKPWAVMFSGKDRDVVRVNLNIVNNKKITQEADRGFTFKVQ